MNEIEAIVLALESGGRRYDRQGRLLTSPKGAKGEMQVMDATNRDPGYGVRPARDSSPAERARVGRDYLAAMVREFGGDRAKALAAYNAGPGAVQKAMAGGGDWLARVPTETQNYVRKGTKMAGPTPTDNEPMIVELPDGTELELPPSTTPEQATAAAKKYLARQGQGGVAAEVGRVVDKGVRKGVTGFPGFIGDVVMKGVKESNQPSTLGASGSAPALALRLMTSIFGNPAADTKFGDVTKTLETGGGALPPVSQPQTRAGQAAANIIEPTIATVLGGGAGTIGQKAVIGAAGGAGGEGAASLFGDNALVRILGALLGSGVAGFAQARTPNAEKLVRQATEHVTDADWQKAQAMEKVLNANQVPHAKSQLLGPRSTLDDVVATASANPSVRPKVTTATEGAPRAAEKAIADWTTQNLPTAGPLNRSEVLSDVQGVAEQALKGIRTKSNKAFEAAMPPTSLQYPEARTKALYEALTDLADSPKYGKVPLEGDAIRRLAERLKTGSSWDTSGVHPVLINKAKAEAKAAGKVFDPSTLAGAKQVDKFATSAHEINNLAKGLRRLVKDDPNYNQLPVDDVVATLKRFTPEFDPARTAKATIMSQEHAPASRGLVGQLANMGGGVKPDKLTARDTALSTVFNPTQPQGQAIKDMAKTLGPKGGEQVGELLREHISKTMQQVLRQDDKSPRNFVQTIYESPAQKENIDAALEVVAKQYGQNPDAIKIGFRRLMEALDTFQDLKVASGVSPGTTAAEAGRNIVSQAATPLTGTRRFFEQKVTASTYNKIADLVIQPDGLKKLQIIAKTKDPATIQQIIVSTMTSASQSPKSGD